MIYLYWQWRKPDSLAVGLYSLPNGTQIRIADLLDARWVDPTRLALSPDRRWLAFFASVDGDNETRLWLVDVEATAPTAVATPGDLRLSQYSRHALLDTRWLSENTLLTGAARPDGSWGVYLIDVAQDEMRTIVEYPATIQIEDVAWSPERSDWLALSITNLGVSDIVRELVIVPLDDSDPAVALPLPPHTLDIADICIAWDDLEWLHSGRVRLCELGF